MIAAASKCLTTYRVTIWFRSSPGWHESAISFLCVHRTIREASRRARPLLGCAVKGGVMGNRFAMRTVWRVEVVATSGAVAAVWATDARGTIRSVRTKAVEAAA